MLNLVPRPAAPADTAVVFVHGYLCVAPPLYWAGLRPLRRALAARGLAVVTSRQPRTGSVEARARRLAAALDLLPHRRLVLVGHSMGGLDARLAASRLDPRRRVARVVTVGAPHRGSPLAELALASPAWRARLARLLDRGALIDLTPEGASRLDAQAPDRDDVAYVSLAGALPAPDLPRPFRRQGELLARDHGANDGMVPLSSAARWPGPDPLAADHLGLIGAVVDASGWRLQLGRARAALAALGRTLEGSLDAG